MYNNFLVEKNKKEIQIKAKTDKRLKKWIQNYHNKVRPQLLDKYNQRVNSFITKIEENPWELKKYEAVDVKQAKQQFIRQKISQLSRKGERTFKFRDANDFNSYFTEAQRIERQKNKKLFEKKYGDPEMAYRSIASQSGYNPRLMNQFRSRQKQRQINPPMRYTSKNLPLSLIPKRKAKSVLNKSDYKNQKTQVNKEEQNDYQLIQRRKTSYSVSFIGTEDDARSSHSIRSQSESSQNSKKKLNKYSLTLQNYYSNQNKKKQVSNKSYFNGIKDIKQNSDDPHVKKTLHNILVKIGKSHPNPRDKALASNIQVFASQIS